LEVSGYDPEITTCKIVVLPIKLYPLLIYLYKEISEKGLEPLWSSPTKLKLVMSTIPSLGFN
jgi:hypothetical protein